ncbi:ead/Ea22-like family protein [Salmonella enterica]|nr:ead/Ea22-like family protein [Salmonella enterica]EBG8578034.1 ead/Ea22-like family protein [Salmonella enterica]EDB9085128.1 ead/Ea22-like family protein [Salmonella enterica subsp. enterica serovar Newport]EGG8904494.1 ead/Ea22-like family protein [Salmonella enterica]EGO1196938.1 ead/Ea22-like family protein [Salmonella enterica]
MTIDKQALLVSKAKASVFTMRYISQFEASDIDSDDIDLRFEVDGTETGTTVSIVDECGHAAQIITALLDENIQLQRGKDALEAVALALRDDMRQAREQLAAAEKRNAEQREYYEGVIADGSKRIAELEKGHQEAAKQINSWRRLAKQNIAERGKDISELEAARQRIAELEARAVNLPKRSVDEVMHLSGFSRDYAEGWCAGNDNAIHEIRTAGIKVKGE